MSELTSSKTTTAVQDLPPISDLSPMEYVEATLEAYKQIPNCNRRRLAQIHEGATEIEEILADPTNSQYETLVGLGKQVTDTLSSYLGKPADIKARVEKAKESQNQPTFETNARLYRLFSAIATTLIADIWTDPLLAHSTPEKQEEYIHHACAALNQGEGSPSSKDPYWGLQSLDFNKHNRPYGASYMIEGSDRLTKAERMIKKLAAEPIPTPR